MTRPTAYYFDTHIPAAVAQQLRLRGITVVRCEEVGLAAADDVEHLEYATSISHILVSHDRDFWDIHADWLANGLHHAGIVLFNNQLQGNVGRLVSELVELCEMIETGAGTLEQDVYNQVYEIKR
jgi:predicted nuclease of predicted toxin-antitoxin system